MKKIYERPEAEVVSFAAMEQLASLLDMDLKLANEDGVGGTISAVTGQI